MKSHGHNQGLPSFSRLCLKSSSKETVINDSFKEPDIVSKYFTSDESKHVNVSQPVGVHSSCSKSDESPFKNMLTEMQDFDANCSEIEKSDFKSPKHILHQKRNNKLTSTGKSCKASSKNRSQKRKKTIGPNQMIFKPSIREDASGEYNEEHIELALALSRSLIDNNENEESNSIRCPSTQEKLSNIKQTLLPFSYRSDLSKLETESRRCVSTQGKKRAKPSKFKYLTPILHLRTQEDRERLISEKVSLILENNMQHDQLFNSNTFSFTKPCSKLLQKQWNNENKIFKMSNCSTTAKDDSNYYVTTLNIPNASAPCGNLLRDWGIIPGRTKSPLPNVNLHNDSYNKTDLNVFGGNNSITEEIRLCDSPQSTTKNTCMSPELFESDEETGIPYLKSTISRKVELQFKNEVLRNTASTEELLPNISNKQNDNFNNYRVSSISSVDEGKKNDCIDLTQPPKEDYDADSSEKKLELQFKNEVSRNTASIEELLHNISNKQNDSFNNYRVSSISSDDEGQKNDCIDLTQSPKEDYDVDSPEKKLELQFKNEVLRNNATIEESLHNISNKHNDNFNNYRVSSISSDDEGKKNDFIDLTQSPKEDYDADRSEKKFESSLKTHITNVFEESLQLVKENRHSKSLNITDYIFDMLNKDDHNYYLIEKELGIEKIINPSYELANDEIEHGNTGFQKHESFKSTSSSTISRQSTQESIIISDEELNYSCMSPDKSKSEINYPELNLNTSEEIEHDSNNILINKSSNLLVESFNELLNEPSNEKSVVCTGDEYKLKLTETFDTPKKDVVIKTVDVTPMSNYDGMNTPTVNKELLKFGLKPLKRQRGVQILKHIYETTHPVVNYYEHSESDEDNVRVAKRRKNLAKLMDESEKHSSKKDSKVTENMELKLEERIEIVGDLLGTSETIDDLIFEKSQSRKISSCRVPLHIAWHNLLAAQPKLRESVLLYEPLQLEVLYKSLKDQGYKYNVKDLISFLDRKCITIRTNQNQRNNKKTKKQNSRNSPKKKKSSSSKK